MKGQQSGYQTATIERQVHRPAAFAVLLRQLINKLFHTHYFKTNHTDHHEIFACGGRQ
jgi:hypothetical protein